MLRSPPKGRFRFQEVRLILAIEATLTKVPELVLLAFAILQSPVSGSSLGGYAYVAYDALLLPDPFGSFCYVLEPDPA